MRVTEYRRSRPASAFTTASTALSNAITAFDPRRGRTLAISRTLLTVAQLSILVGTPVSYLFTSVGQEPAGPECERYNSLTAFCLADRVGVDLQFISWVLVVILLFVGSGYFPRYTGVLHLYTTFSISTPLRLPDGGDEAAKLFAFFLAIICLSDNRLNHWHDVPFNSAPSALAPVSWAGWIGVRIQIFWIYITAAVGKTAVPEWQDGTAIYYVSRQAFFGYNGPLQEAVLWLTSVSVITIAATWGTIVLELMVAAFVLMPRRFRIIAVIISSIFHVGIIVLIGLFSFGLVMIAGVLLCIVVDFESTKDNTDERADAS